MHKLEPLCKISSPHPLVYISENEAITLHEVATILSTTPIKPIPKRRAKPVMIVWTNYENQVEICFDAADAANQMKVKTSYVKNILEGRLLPPRDAFIVPISDKALFGYSRAKLLAAIEFNKYTPNPRRKKMMFVNLGSKRK
jgi:hypothetical protein